MYFKERPSRISIIWNGTAKHNDRENILCELLISAFDGFKNINYNNFARSLTLKDITV